MSAGKKKNGRAKYVIAIIFLLFVLLCTTVLLYVQNLGFAYKPDSKRYYHVEIEDGTSASGISKILEEKGIVKFSHEFAIFSRLKRLSGKYQAGTYSLSPSMSMKEIADIISTGQVNTVKVSIPEGYTEYEIADLLADMGLVKKKDFIKALESGRFKAEYSFLKETKDGKHMLEGYLAPKTYDIPANATNDDIIRMMLDEHRNLYNIQERGLAKLRKRSEYEIMIIASIIEKECGVPEDHRNASSVIYNRLKKKMPLQMDSTIQYVFSLEGKRKKEYEVSNADTQIDSPYNTYTRKGLPVGPICNPGASAIKAALDPEVTKYIYFVLSDKLDGSLKFSVNYSDFERDKNAYYEAVANSEGN